MRADEGDFFDRINMIFEKDIQRRNSSLCFFMSFMFLMSKISLPSLPAFMISCLPVKIP